MFEDEFVLLLSTRPSKIRISVHAGRGYRGIKIFSVVSDPLAKPSASPQLSYTLALGVSLRKRIRATSETKDCLSRRSRSLRYRKQCSRRAWGSSIAVALDWSSNRRRPKTRQRTKRPITHLLASSPYPRRLTQYARLPTQSSALKWFPRLPPTARHHLAVNARQSCRW
ncbi:hypothetical protein GQ53DRAFT_426649 [Thozetella sp. PMI_491]|nr:hypothetical protein GQ53DRAFT_426649 [Thozetella sp. PMI_491]